MTVKEFMTRIESYYGEYGPGQRPIILAYLSRRGDRYLDVLFPRVVEGFTSTYRTQPDVAIFENYRGDVTERLRTLPPPDRTMIEDLSRELTDEEREEMKRLMGEYKKTIQGLVAEKNMRRRR